MCKLNNKRKDKAIFNNLVEKLTKNKMSSKERFIEHYKNGYMPWAHEQPDFNIIEIVDNWPIKPCKTLEIACGTGTDSIWLAKQGFDTTAYDVSPIAIKMAKDNAAKQNTVVDFQLFDFLASKLKSKEFGFVLDRGFFHGFDKYEERNDVAKRVYEVLEEKGLWLSLIGNADGVKTDPGPPLRSLTEVVSAIEPYFKILSINSSNFGNDQEDPAKIWACLMRKR